MNTLLRGIVVASVLLLLAAPLFAGGAQEVDFLAEFENSLQEEGFSEEEAQAIAEAARSHDWNGADAADPDLVAQAIARADDDGAELNADENALLALELARNAVELREEGSSESEVAQATLGAVEQLQEQIRAWRDGDQEEPLGETVRNTVRETAETAARERAATSESDGTPDEEAGETPTDAAPVEPGSGTSGAGKR